ncbi:hypothetical protein LSH36_2993g00003, partial [Paralvinella palmiformis]
MDVLLPNFRIHDISISPNRQQCVLRCSKAAVLYQKQNVDRNP